ncbi:MAG TPA: hypothetical protein VMM76_05440 [Pirellulaceae bacterium]|nr:hypothetical protein [Pirellulaceae bacterium]
MTSQHDKPKRWWPRFSIRTLVIVVTLVCLYLGCWVETTKYGIPAVADHIRHPAFLGPDGERFDIEGSWPTYGQPTSPLPFLVTVSTRTWVLVDANGVELEDVNATHPFATAGEPDGREYYLWFFGYVTPSNVHVVKREDIVYQ